MDLLFKNDAKEKDIPAAEPTAASKSASNVLPKASKKAAPSEPKEPIDWKNLVKANRLLLFICGGVAAVMLIMCIVAYVMVGSASDSFGGRIIDNTTIAGVQVGGMTQRQAAKAVSTAVGESYKQNDMVLMLPDVTFHFTPADTGISLNVNAAAKAAFDLGRSGTPEEQKTAFENSQGDGNLVELLPYMTLNEDAIRSVLNDYAKDYHEVYTPSGFTLEGECQELGEEDFDSELPAQTLVLTTGTSGFTLDMDRVYEQILDAYYHDEFLVDLSDGVITDTPKPLDIQAIYDETAIAPVEPILDRATMQVTPGAYGMDFDLDAAKELVSNAKLGETLRIPMRYVAPNLLGDEVYYQDELGYALTPHSNNENRNTNLRLACAALDGIILQPGEILSYNDTLGQRTAENGYLPAPAYSGTNLVDSIGGGICQVSSTLYLSALFAELEIVDRINHGYPVNYIPAGLDATVNWGDPDLKIRNPYDLPIKIHAEESDGFVKIKILGTDLRDYTVKMEFRANGHYSKTVKVKFDAAGKEISRVDDRLSSYISGNVSAYGQIGSGQAYINGNVKTPEFNTVTAP